MAIVLTPMVLMDLVVFLGIMHFWRRQKESRRRLRLVLAPFLFLVISNTSPIAYLALGTLEWRFPPSDDVPPDARAIVILAGSIRAADSVRMQHELGPTTYYRCKHGLVLHRANPDRLILLSGGAINGEDRPSAAAVMRDFLLSQGVNGSQIVLEERSQNTYENAVESCRLLQERDIHRIVLVTDASHMRRASACFRKQGMDIKPSPCNHIANEYHFSWIDFFPNVGNAALVDVAWHEWLGLASYWLQGASDPAQPGKLSNLYSIPLQ